MVERIRHGARRHEGDRIMNVTELYPAIGKNRYCGPGALAIVTGVATDETAKAIREVSGKRAVKGCSNSDLVWAGKRLGVELVERANVKGLRLNQWIADGWTKEPGSVFVVNVTGHY